MDAQRFGYSVGQFFKKIDRTFDNISSFIRLSITIGKWGCYIPQIKSRQVIAPNHKFGKIRNKLACFKGIETLIDMPASPFLWVESPRPTSKRFPIRHQSAVCFLNKLHLSNFYE